MGQAFNCKSCCSDIKHDLELRNSIVCAYKSENTDVMTQEATEPFQLKVDSCIFDNAATKLQAVWRTVAVIRQVKRITRHRIRNHDYFSREEVLETLNSNTILAAEHTQKPAYRYTSGAVYTGQWLGGFRDGWGIMVYPLGEKYEGYWSFGRPFGQGKFTYEGGQCYYGRWGNPLSIGQTSLCKTGEGWKSVVSDGYEWLWYMEELPKIPDVEEQHRNILQTLKTTQKRIDSIKQSVGKLQTFKKGRGRKVVEIKSEEAIYTGEGLAGMKDGFGSQVWKNGDLYEGQWKENKQQGWGRNVWQDRSEYIGTFKQDAKDGVGEYRWNDGTRYSGEWTDNQMHGCGCYTWADGRFYIGDWRAGLMQGYGTFYYADGVRYEGGWFQGRKHGVGTTFKPDGGSSKVVWRYGKVEGLTE